MKTRKMLRIAGLAALTLVALGAIGYAAGGRSQSGLRTDMPPR
jgi:hypothetical protein